MKRLIVIPFIFVLLISSSRHIVPKKKNISREVQIDTFNVNWFLNEPIDFKRLDSLNTKIIRKISQKKVLNGDDIIVTYIEGNKIIGEMKGFQHKIDSTWLFGHSGWFMNSFICKSEKLPLKFNLEVNTDISNFLDFFGKPTEQNSKQLRYDFSNLRSNKILTIYLKDEKVKSIEILRTNPI